MLLTMNKIGSQRKILEIVNNCDVRRLQFKSNFTKHRTVGNRCVAALQQLNCRIAQVHFRARPPGKGVVGDENLKPAHDTATLAECKSSSGSDLLTRQDWT